MTTQEQITTFLAGKRFAVVGASQDRSKYGNKVLRVYMQNKLEVVPINPTAAEVEGLTAYPDLASAPGEIDGVSIITPTPPNCRKVGTPNENMPKCSRLGAMTFSDASPMTGLGGHGRPRVVLGDGRFQECEGSPLGVAGCLLDQRSQRSQLRLDLFAGNEMQSRRQDRRLYDRMLGAIQAKKRTLLAALHWTADDRRPFRLVIELVHSQ